MWHFTNEMYLSFQVISEGIVHEIFNKDYITAENLHNDNSQRTEVYTRMRITYTCLCKWVNTRKNLRQKFVNILRDIQNVRILLSVNVCVYLQAHKCNSAWCVSVSLCFAGELV